MTTPLQDEINRGIKARDLLENDLLTEALATIHANYVSAWLAAPPRDTEGREALWYLVQALETFRGHLTTVLQTGQMAEQELADLRRQRAI